MKTYTVFTNFRDKERGSKSQKVGDPYDVSDLSDERIAFLLGPIDELKGLPAIFENEEVEEKEEYPQHVGGGYYVLSNGERVRGKDDAFKAEKELI